jgi:PKD repeat protein
MSVLVSFFDTSSPGPSGPITAWSWTFGDGGTSTAQNPTHTYATVGKYAVSLQVTGSGSDGTSSVSKVVTVF